jgi:hypothetical protein
MTDNTHNTHDLFDAMRRTPQSGEVASIPGLDTLETVGRAQAYPDSFKDYPKTLSETKSDKSGQPEDWTVRDMLIATLRDLDAGKFNPDVMVICFTTFDRVENQTYTGYKYRSANLVEALGCVEVAKARLMGVIE